MFSIFKKAEKKEAKSVLKNEKQYITVLLDEHEAGNRIMLLTEIRGRISAMPNECDRDKVLRRIDEELGSLVDRFGEVKYASINKKDYDKMMDAAVKKNLGL